jgi:hypothetical protein
MTNHRTNIITPMLRTRTSITAIIYKAKKNKQKYTIMTRRFSNFPMPPNNNNILKLLTIAGLSLFILSRPPPHDPISQ